MVILNKETIKIETEQDAVFLRQPLHSVGEAGIGTEAVSDCIFMKPKSLACRNGGFGRFYDHHPRIPAISVSGLSLAFHPQHNPFIMKGNCKRLKILAYHEV